MRRASEYVPGYTLEAIDEVTRETIVSIRLKPEQASRVMRRVWPDSDFWGGPGGGSAKVESSTEADAINEELRTVFIRFDPAKYRWLFHVHLVEKEDAHAE
jgi:hypothetical protein